jgi:hypothetical protein
MKVFVRLKDGGSIFNDPTQNVAVIGNLPVELENTKRVQRGISGGIIEKISKPEADRLFAESEGSTSKVDAERLAKENKAKSDFTEIENQLKAKVEELKINLAANTELVTRVETQEVEISALKKEITALKTKNTNLGKKLEIPKK